MALIWCPECHNGVSTDAETCPHCGFPIKNLTNNDIENIHKEKRGRSKTSWIIIVLMLTLVPYLIWNIKNDENKSVQQESTVIEEIPIEYPTDVMVMTMDEIEKGCPNNLDDAIYLDKYVQFTGEIIRLESYTTLEIDRLTLEKKEVLKWIVGFSNIPDDDDYTTWGINITCHVEIPEEYAKLQNYKIGDTITITGKCFHAHMMSVIFENCFINYNISE